MSGCHVKPLADYDAPVTFMGCLFDCIRDHGPVLLMTFPYSLINWNVFYTLVVFSPTWRHSIDKDANNSKDICAIIYCLARSVFLSDSDLPLLWPVSLDATIVSCQNIWSWWPSTIAKLILTIPTSPTQNRRSRFRVRYGVLASWVVLLSWASIKSHGRNQPPQSLLFQLMI